VIYYENAEGKIIEGKNVEKKMSKKKRRNKKTRRKKHRKKNIEAIFDRKEKYRKKKSRKFQDVARQILLSFIVIILFLSDRSH